MLSGIGFDKAKQVLTRICTFFLATQFFLAIQLVTQTVTPAFSESLPDHLRFPEIEVLALLPNAVMLKVNGEEVLLNAGDTTNSGLGVNWVSADQVEVQFWDETRRMGLSEKISSNFAKPSRSVASILIDNNGQYLVDGSINNKPVTLLVDTGANIMAMSSEVAKRLALDYKSGASMFVNTSSGIVKSYKVNLDRVQVGNIVLEKIDATVIPGKFPQKILLGMSFLEKVEMSEQAGLMTLILK